MAHLHTDGQFRLEHARGSCLANYWLSWILGTAILIAVVVAALHASEGREFVGVAARGKPWWLLLAVCLQGATYLAQGGISPRAARSW